MARPKLKGLLYFPLDIDFFEDNSIRIVRARYKSDGVIIYLYLLTQIYREGYYITTDDDFWYKMCIRDRYMSNKPDMERVIQVLISLLEEQEHVEITYTIEKEEDKTA